MSKSDLVWNGQEADELRRWKLQHALHQTDLATARVQGIKAATIANGPTQMDLRLRFPFPGHRTCAEWTTP